MPDNPDVIPDPPFRDLVGALRLLDQTAVLWAADGNDTYGKPRVRAPIDIPVRWLKNKREVRNPETRNHSSTDKAIVELDIPIGSIMCLGKVEELPYPLSELRTVVDFRKTPDIKNRKFKRTAVMDMYHGELPRGVNV